MAKNLYSFRLPPDLVEWVDANTESLGAATRTELVQSLLQALRENRLLIKPRAGANAFPANEVCPGESADYPILVSYPDSTPPTD